ncbi:uracil-xanthine permease family protein [Streptomonospora litoralis]|uniref:Pyrimidine permease RutG n=1 Tax=Streptomonospora litoralis TaxID=2498135 RepID=A0A4P6Q4H5_9ACTN|nr:solute carrier family 23 protein [Streptomonospora litoralis]QBI55606.1 Putative pyrimidine permease RutG [Streptomonospora litoralis]
MNLGLRWKLYGDGSAPPPGEVVRPQERLSWGRTAGLGAQHVIAMFGATFVFPVIMGLDPNLAIMMSGVATILFLLIVQGRVPSYLGTSASFVAAAAVISPEGANPAVLTGAILVAGVVLALSGVAIHLLGPRAVLAAFPPAVTGAVVMLIGFNLAPVVAENYWPFDQWVGLLTMAFVILATVLLRGFLGRITILLGLVFGFVLSWVFDQAFGAAPLPEGQGGGAAPRVDLGAVGDAAWIGLPDFHAPVFETSAILVALPAVIALIAENAGHVKAVQEMTGDDLNPYMGRAIFADGLATSLASSVGGSPTTTYAENIGVMAATRVYSTAAYYVAALVAILFGLCPKFGELVAATPAGVLGGITVVLYGMIGLLGAKIWVENRVDFGNPIVLVPLAAGLIAGIGGVSLHITEGFSLEGIALGTIIILAGYHVLYRLAPASMRPAPAPDGIEDGHDASDSGAGVVLGSGVDTRDDTAAPSGGVGTETGKERREGGGQVT